MAKEMRKLEKEDLTSGVDAEVTFELNNKTYSGGHITKFQTKVEALKKQVKVLGRKQELSKENGVKNTFSYECFYVSDLLAKQIVGYINGENPWPTLKITATQKNSTLGSSTLVYTGCSFDDYILTNIDVNEENISRNGSGTFVGVTMPKCFKQSAVPEL